MDCNLHLTLVQDSPSAERGDRVILVGRANQDAFHLRDMTGEVATEVVLNLDQDQPGNSRGRHAIR